MSTPLTVRIERAADGQLVLLATGEIDASNVGEFAEALNAGADGGSDILTVDLSAVDYLDSAAINALVPHAESLHIIANPVLMRVLIVSDGIVEQFDAGETNPLARKQFGMDGIERVLRENPAGDAVATLFEALIAHAGTTHLADDATGVMVRWE